MGADRLGLDRCARAVVLAALVGAAAAGACSRGDRAVSGIREALDRRDYREAVARCKHAIRRGVDRADVYYYYGLALVGLNRDFEGFRRIDEAVGRDPALAPAAAEALFESGRDAWRRGERPKAMRRVHRAAVLDPALDVGPFAYLVADAYYEGRDDEAAAAWYRRAVRAFPDTAAAEDAWMRIAEASIRTGATVRAREALETLLERFPRGRHRKEARWRLVNLLVDEAEKQQVLGNYAETIEILRRVTAETDNTGLLQRSYFMMGEANEAMGEIEEAYACYRRVIETDRGASGGVVERAREKIAAIEEVGGVR